MVQFAGWWVNVQCCFYHFWSYQMRRRPNSPFGRGVFCDGLLAVTKPDRSLQQMVTGVAEKNSHRSKNKEKKVVFLCDM
jgi:hypothetical protein